jgi:plasmid stability protein
MQAGGSVVGQLTVRKVDDDIIRRLKIRAAEHGRSAEAEHRSILRQVLMPEPRMSMKAWLERAREQRAQSEPVSDSTPIIREMRDQR